MRRSTGDNNVGGRGRERGAVLPMAAAGIVVAVIAAALSIDLGAMALKRRDLQKIADLAAMDAMYALQDAQASGVGWPIDQVTQSLLSDNGPVAEEAEASARRNGLEPDDAIDFVVEVGVYERDAADEFIPCAELLLDVTLDCAAANAVRVEITDEQPRYFDLSNDVKQTTVDSIASLGTAATNDIASIQVGSFAGRVQSGESPFLSYVLESIVGADKGSLRSDVVSYEGISYTDLTLDQLAAELTAGDVDALLEANVTYAELLDATVTILENEGHTAEAEAVATIRQSIEAAGPAGSVAGVVHDAVTAAPVPGAVVTVPAAATPATTDGQGQYLIENVTSGPRTVTAEAPGYEAGSTIVTVDGETTADPILLTPGPGASDGDAGGGALPPEQRGSVAGTVTDTGGTALAGARVSVGGLGTPAVTAGDGSYRVVNVPAGDHTVTASLGGYGTATAPATVAGGAEAVVDLALTPPPPPGQTGDGGNASVSDELVVPVERVVSVPGPDGSVDSTDTPINTLDLIMLAAHVANGDNGVGFTLSSGDGDLPPEIASHVAQIDFTATMVEPPSPLTFGPVGTSAHSGQIRLDATITYAETFDVTTGVLVATISGRVTDEVSGAPIAGATAVLDGVVTTATTDADGIYLIDEVLVGAHTVTFDAPGYAGETAPVTIVEGQQATLDAALASAVPAAGQVGDGGGIDPASPLPPLTGDIVGTVTDGAGNPVPSVTVTIGIGTAATTAADGTYLIDNVLAGTYVVTATRDGYDGQAVPVLVEVGKASTANLQIQQQPAEPLGVIGDGGAAVLEQTVATSTVQVPFRMELVRSTGEIAGLDCVQSIVKADVDTGAAAFAVAVVPGDGEEDQLVSGLPSFPLPEELAAVDVLLDSVLTGSVLAYDHEVDAASYGDEAFGPTFAHTRTFGEPAASAPEPVPSGGDVGAAYSAMAEAMAEQIDPLVDLTPLVDSGVLTPDQAAENEQKLHTMLDESVVAGADGIAPVTALLDLISAGFGVTVLGTDVTIGSLECEPGSTGTGPAVPALVE